MVERTIHEITQTSQYRER